MILYTDAKVFNLIDSKGNILETTTIEIPCYYPEPTESMEDFILKLEKTNFFQKLQSLKRYCKNDIGENTHSKTGIFGALIQGLILSARETYKPNVDTVSNSKEQLLESFMSDEITEEEYKASIQKLKENPSTGNKKGKWVVAKEDKD